MMDRFGGMKGKLIPGSSMKAARSLEVDEAEDKKEGDLIIPQAEQNRAHFGNIMQRLCIPAKNTEPNSYQD